MEVRTSLSFPPRPVQARSVVERVVDHPPRPCENDATEDVIASTDSWHFSAVTEEKFAKLCICRDENVAMLCVVLLPWAPCPSDPRACVTWHVEQGCPSRRFPVYFGVLPGPPRRFGNAFDGPPTNCPTWSRATPPGWRPDVPGVSPPSYRPSNRGSPAPCSPGSLRRRTAPTWTGSAIPPTCVTGQAPCRCPLIVPP